MFDPKKHKKIVMVTPERLGDTLMCTPAIHYLKHYCPSVEIDIIALSELSHEVLQNNPDIHRIFVLPSQKLLKSSTHSYDHGINIHDEPEGRDYFKMLKVPTVHLPPKNPEMHQAEQALQFIQSLLKDHPPIIDRNYRLFPITSDYAHIEKIFHQHHVDLKKDILIGCQIGCHSIAKRKFSFLKKAGHPKVWPFEYFVELAHKLHDYNPHIKIVITGSKSEKTLGKKLGKLAPNIINFIDKTTVPQLYALMQYLKVFISPDTGVMHVAACADIPLIALFGPTILKRTGPYPELKDLTLIQAPTMLEITVPQVLAKTIEKINQYANIK